jgi:membrane protease YdiL (CAAX protease family)
MVTITSVFWNSEEARLRAGWRIVVFFLSSFVLGEALFRLRGTLLSELLPVVAYRGAIEAGTYLLLIGVLVWLVASRLDRRRIVDYGFHLTRAWGFDLGFGLALGTLLLLGIFVLELAMGWIKVTGTIATAPGQPFGAMIVAGFIAVLFVAVQEEITWRGYPIKNLAEGFNWKVIGPGWATVIAILISSLLFGLAHSDNPNATTLSTINIMVFAVLFAAGYVLTGQLALPIGLHFAWDFVQGFVFGVTGGASQWASFLVVAEDDPAAKLWTGLPYGAEGGLLGTGAFVLGLVLTAAWVRLRRGSIHLHPSLAQPPPQSRAA